MTQTKQIEKLKDITWVKSLLNNLALLKWVRKCSADGLLDDNKMAEGFGVKTNDESISITDSTLTKVLTTHCRFSGKELVRFNMKQLAEVVELLGKEGELIITDSKYKEMVIQIADTCVVVCPLSKSDSGAEA